MSIAAPKQSDVPRFEHIVTREDESFLWRRDDYPWERNVWNYHPEVEIHLIKNASGIAFVGDYIGEFGPGYLTIVGGGLPHDWVTALHPGQRIAGRDTILQFDSERILRFRDQIPELAELDGFMHRIQRGVAFTGSTAVTPREIFEDHLRLRVEGDLEEDLRRNYSKDVVLLTSNSDFVGHDGIRVSAARLDEQLPDASFTFLSKRVHGPYAFLIWEGRSSHLDATSGADSFVIENDKIVFQSIHYALADR